MISCFKRTTPTCSQFMPNNATLSLPPPPFVFLSRLTNHTQKCYRWFSRGSWHVYKARMVNLIVTNHPTFASYLLDFVITAFSKIWFPFDMNFYEYPQKDSHKTNNSRPLFHNRAKCECEAGDCAHQQHMFHIWSSSLTNCFSFKSHEKKLENSSSHTPTRLHTNTHPTSKAWHHIS